MCFQRSLRRFSLQATQRSALDGSDEQDTPSKAKKSIALGGKSAGSSGFSRMSFNTRLNTTSQKKTETSAISDIPEEGVLFKKIKIFKKKKFFMHI